MYKSTPITQKCKSSPARFYTPPGVNQNLIAGEGTSANKFNDNVAVTDEDKEKQNAKEVAKTQEQERQVTQSRNPAQQARYEGRKERQSIRQKGRAERIEAKNISRAKSVQERVDNKNKYLNTSNTSTNIDQPVVNPITGKKSYGDYDEFDYLEGKFQN